MTLSTAVLAEHLDRISYKPGWGIDVYDGRWEGQHVVITVDVPDSYHPGSTVTLDIHSMLPPQRTLADFERWLAWRLARIEVHEMREFLRRDGQPIFDPHALHADRDVR